MNAIYLDCFSGISGNMLLGAFLQAGVPLAYLETELQKVIPAEEFRIRVTTVSKNGIQADYVEVEVQGGETFHPFGTTGSGPEQAHDHVHDHGHIHDYDHDYGHGHEHVHTHDHGHDHGDGHPHHHVHDQAAHSHGHGMGHVHSHRTMADIRRMIVDSELSDRVKKRAIAIFTCLAEAEGKVHGRPVDEVHFHEVGATDSIVDIIGTALALEYLEIDKVFVSRVNTGSGQVECAHGTMMVPAPATAELLRGFPFYHREEEKELTTPTGAAVIHALGVFAENLPSDFQPEKIAYGAGYWDLKAPNVLRVYFGEYQGRREQKRYVLETNIDDMNPQDYGYVYEKLLEAGALDVWTTPIYMKKNRPAVTLSVLVDEEHKEICSDIIFWETTSIGLRVVPVEQRREAMRRTAKVDTPYGEVSCKISAYKGHIVSLSAEYEDCRRLAIEQGVPLKKVRQSALSELSRRLGEN